jgi:transcriptional antiterminator NusG
MHTQSDEFEQPNMPAEAAGEQPLDGGDMPQERQAEEPSAAEAPEDTPQDITGDAQDEVRAVETAREETPEESAGEAQEQSPPSSSATEETPEGSIVEAEAENPASPAEAEEPSGELPGEEAQATSLAALAADEAAEAPHEPSPDQPAWYVVHCYSGYENKVRHNLEQRIETMGMKNKIFEVVIPTQEEIEVREGKRRTVERHIFPGYVLVNMILTEESWYVVRNTPGVTGFVGMGTSPTPLRPEEVNQIIKRMEAEAPRVKVSFKEGERVRIIDGPFNDFRGTVAEIDMERSKVRVMVSMFGRETPVELDFLQVERA